MLPLPSEAAVALFHSVNCCPLLMPAHMQKSFWMSSLCSEEELARSCSTEVVGRDLLDQTVLIRIKCKLSICKCNDTLCACIVHSVDSYKYQIPKDKLEEAWTKTVCDELNMRCRTYYKKEAS